MAGPKFCNEEAESFQLDAQEFHFDNSRPLLGENGRRDTKNNRPTAYVVNNTESSLSVFDSAD